MATAFARTLQHLEPRRSRRAVAAVATAVSVAAAWGVWAVTAHITVYEVSDRARLEVDHAPHPVDAPISGTVVESRMQLGQEVSAGDALLRLDADAEQLSVREQREKSMALDAELTALRAQASSVERARDEGARAARALLDETRERIREAEAPAGYAQQELERLERLRVQLLISEHDFELGRADALRTQASAESVRLSLVRIEQEQVARDRDRAASLDQIRGQIARLEGERRGSQEALLRLRVEADRHVVRASASGRLGDAAALRPGAVVQAGQRLALIVPDGAIVAIAQFSPSAASGRIRRGQRARVRLDGFPWAQYGTVEATVAQVANEVRDGTVRVELAVAAGSNARIALEHGLTGSVEIAVERVTPLTLLLRTAGALQTAPASAERTGN
ncbi:MAG TPA: HlyD family efflux transporter periplasmic adaptor subunit [Vicinamibacterales bacterium]|nr:HlyD family efflux transporter periplasmic adaptor subunit [Vicinamibacterales bacterium]